MSYYYYYCPRQLVKCSLMTNVKVCVNLLDSLDQWSQVPGPCFLRGWHESCTPSPTSPVLGMYLPLAVPQWSRFQGHSLERVRCWNHLDSICDWTQLRPLYKLVRFWQAGGRSPWLVVPKTSLVRKFPGLSHLPPPHLEWLPLSLIFLRPPCVGLVCEPACAGGEVMVGDEGCGWSDAGSSLVV